MIDCALYQRFAALFGRKEEGGAGNRAADLSSSDTFRNALTRLQNKSAMNSPSFWKRRDAVEWQRVDDRIRRFALLFQTRMASYNVPVFVHGAYRGSAEQNALYDQGVTKARAGQSAHNVGAAVDIVHYGFYWDLTAKEWELFGAMGKDVAASLNLRVTWGGDFKSIYDPAHWELTDWKSLLP